MQGLGRVPGTHEPQLSDSGALETEGLSEKPCPRTSQPFPGVRRGLRSLGFLGAQCHQRDPATQAP